MCHGKRFFCLSLTGLEDVGWDSVRTVRIRCALCLLGTKWHEDDGSLLLVRMTPQLFNRVLHFSQRFLVALTIDALISSNRLERIN